MKDSIIHQQIRQARIASMVCGIITLASLVSLLMNHADTGISYIALLAMLDVLFIFCMAYGIHRKSRTCAVLMLEYFVLSKIFSISLSPQLHAGPVIIASIFLFFLFQGVRGTFAHHKEKLAGENLSSSSIAASITAGSLGLIMYVLILPALFL